MAKLLFRLRHVPEDEADEVRQLLDEAEIDYYETSAGNWRISMPAIWLRDDEKFQEARSILDRYQQLRFEQAREDYKLRKQQGQHQTLWKNFLQEPLKVTFFLGLALLVLYLSIQVFLSLGSR